MRKGANVIIYPVNIVASPLLLVLWALDLYLLAIAIRLLVAGTSGRRIGLEAITDPVPTWLRRWIENRRAKPVAPWIPWAVVIAGAAICRHVLICVLLSLSK